VKESKKEKLFNFSLWRLNCDIHEDWIGMNANRKAPTFLFFVFLYISKAYRFMIENEKKKV
jgi:hypothetical protein